MTTQQLKDRLQRIEFVSYGHFRVTFKVRGVDRSIITTDTHAIDRINSADNYTDRTVSGFYTLKGALETLWDRVNDRYSGC